jgi:hypothetical protein
MSRPEYNTSESRRNLIEQGVFSKAVESLSLASQLESSGSRNSFAQFPHDLHEWSPKILSLYLIQAGAFGHKLYLERYVE